MEFDVRIKRKKWKHRGEDPRLDALADALSELERKADERGARGEGAGDERATRGAPGMIVAGGVDAARAHVAGLAVPADVDHATLEMRKVVLGREAVEGGGRRRGRRWQRGALGAALVAVLSVGISVGSWQRGQGGRDEGERSTAMSAAAVATKEGGDVRGAASMPSGAAPRSTMARVECVEPGMSAASTAATIAATSSACVAGAASVIAPRSTGHAMTGSAPSVQPSSAPSASTAPTMAPGSLGGPTPEKSPSETNRPPEF